MIDLRCFPYHNGREPQLGDPVRILRGLIVVLGGDPKPVLRASRAEDPVPAEGESPEDFRMRADQAAVEKAVAQTRMADAARIAFDIGALRPLDRGGPPRRRLPRRRGQFRGLAGKKKDDARFLADLCFFPGASALLGPGPRPAGELFGVWLHLPRLRLFLATAVFDGGTAALTSGRLSLPFYESMCLLSELAEETKFNEDAARLEKRFWAVRG